MGYGSNEKALNEVSPLGVGIHNDVEIESITAFTTEAKQVGGSTYDVLDINFKSSEGKTFKKRLFSPEKDTNAARKSKDEEYVSNLVAYIATKVNGEPKVVDGSKIDGWDSFTKEAISLIGDYSGKKFQFKLVGSIYQGKPQLDITQYMGWLEPMDSTKRLEFSPSELKGNLDYNQFYSTPTTSSPQGGGGIPEGEKTPF